MNRFFISLALASLLGPVPAFAQAQAPPTQPQQQEDRGGFGVQIVGGPLFTTLDAAQEALDTSSGAGYLVGISMGGNRGGLVGIGADVLYGKKKEEVSGTGFEQSVVHVPVMLKVNLGSENRNGVSVFALGGGFFDWQFDAKATLLNVIIPVDSDGYEVGWLVGGGVEVLRFSVQARYMRGVKEIDKTFAVAHATDIKKQSIAILFGFRLN
jgi:hypothetical protein